MFNFVNSVFKISFKKTKKFLSNFCRPNIKCQDFGIILLFWNKFFKNDIFSKRLNFIVIGLISDGPSDNGDIFTL